MSFSGICSAISAIICSVKWNEVCCYDLQHSILNTPENFEWQKYVVEFLSLHVFGNDRKGTTNVFIPILENYNKNQMPNCQKMTKPFEKYQSFFKLKIILTGVKIAIYW